MIKRIIFDIDNTLIDFPKDYEKYYDLPLKKYNLNISPKDVYMAIGKYEVCGKYKYYNKDELLKVINDELNTNLSIDFMNDFLNMYSTMVGSIDNSIKDTLKYLSSKYELIAYSNWFTDSQVSRMKCACIDKYFTKIYGTDNIPMKPLKEGFDKVCEGLSYDECLMIGDNLEMDIKVPYEMGLNVYYLNKNNNTKYPSIKNISDLKDVL